MDKLNTGETKAEWVAILETMTDEDLRKHCNLYIWLSAYANNNSRSDYHFLCDAGHRECARRGKPEIYAEEHTKLSR